MKPLDKSMTEEVTLATSHPLFGASLKLSRARSHIDEFSTNLKEFLATEPFKHDPFTYDAHRGVYKGKITRATTPPPILGGIAGDAVHNLRCTFDLIASGIIIESNRSDVYFPISKRKDDYKLRGLKTANKRALDLIERYQPFSSPDNVDLLKIRNMDNWDKHRAITTVTILISRYKTSITSDMLAYLTPDNRIARIRLSSPIEGHITQKITTTTPQGGRYTPREGRYVAFPPTPHAEIFQPILDFTVALEGTTDWKEEEALPALERFYAYTSKALRDFCDIFPEPHTA